MPQVVDEFTRECPRIDVDTSLPAARIIAALEQLAEQRGLPKSIVVVNGPEFISRALDLWVYRRAWLPEPESCGAYVLIVW